MMELDRGMIVVRGGGDLATGTIHMLHTAGFKVLVLESERPSAIRRTVAFCEAVYEGAWTVEGVTARLIPDIAKAKSVWAQGEVPVLVDPEMKCINCGESVTGDEKSGSIGTGTDDPLYTMGHCTCPYDPLFSPVALVDAIIAKKNLGTTIDMAPFVIALGPGFSAGVDCHAVVETKRGHNLGRVYYKGSAAPNTGVPGLIAGHAADRVMHAKADGVFYARARIGDVVKKGDVIGEIKSESVGMNGSIGTAFDPFVTASIDGLLRGILHDKYPVTKGFKLADIDPRVEEKENCYTISDKARCIAGGVLGAILKNGSLYPSL